MAVARSAHPVLLLGRLAHEHPLQLLVEPLHAVAQAGRQLAQGRQGHGQGHRLRRDQAHTAITHTSLQPALLKELFL